MDKRILSTIADMSMRTGRGPIGSVDPRAVLADIGGGEKAFRTIVTCLEKDRLITIDEETGLLSLTEDGIRQIIEEARPQPLPVVGTVGDGGVVTLFEPDDPRIGQPFPLAEPVRGIAPVYGVMPGKPKKSAKR